MEKKQTTLRLPADLYERIQQEAECESISMEQKVTDILNQGICCGVLAKQISKTFQYDFERLIEKLKIFEILTLLIFVLIQVFLIRGLY